MSRPVDVLPGTLLSDLLWSNFNPMIEGWKDEVDEVGSGGGEAGRKTSWFFPVWGRVRRSARLKWYVGFGTLKWRLGWLCASISCIWLAQVVHG